MNPLLVLGLLLRLSAFAAARFTNTDKSEPYATPREYAVLVWTLVPLLIVFSVILALSGIPVALPFVPFFVALLFPYPIAKWVLVPRGWARLAWALTATSGIAWRKDRGGGALVAGAWALNMTEKPAPEAVEFLERLLPSERQPLLPSAVLSLGLMASARQDLDGARALIGVVGLFEPKIVPEEAQRLAADWLAADAAARGEWGDVLVIAEDPGPKTRSTTFLGLAAKRLLGKPDAPTDAALKRAALEAGRRCKPLLERAMAVAPHADRAPVATDIPDALGRALYTHVSTVEATGLDRDRLVATARGWDAVFEGADLDRRIAERALTLGATASASARRKLEEMVHADLAALARLSGVPIGGEDGGPTLRRAAALLRDDLITEVETVSRALGRRARERRALPLADEVREWVLVKSTYERAVRMGGLEVRRLVFSQVHSDACALAVWLFNERGQRALGNAMFRWLLGEATVLGNSEAIGLQTKNVACGF